MADARPVWMQGWPATSHEPYAANPSQSPERGRSVAELVSEGNVRLRSPASARASSWVGSLRSAPAPSMHSASAADGHQSLLEQYHAMSTSHENKLKMKTSSEFESPIRVRERADLQPLPQEPAATHAAWQRNDDQPSMSLDMSQSHHVGANQHNQTHEFEYSRHTSVDVAPSKSEIPYSDDPYLERMRANVAALSELTKTLRASVSDELPDLGADSEKSHKRSRTILLDSEQKRTGLDEPRSTRAAEVIERGWDDSQIESYPSSYTLGAQRDKVARDLIDSGSLQFSRFTTDAPLKSMLGGSGAASPGVSALQEGDVNTGAFARLTLVLNHDYNSLVPADSRARELLKRHLAESLAAAVRVQVSRVRVLQLRAGSVIVDVSIRPDTSGCDGRTADELLHALQQQAYDEASELSMLWRTALVQHTSIFEAGDPRELGSPSSASGPAVVVDAARAAANPSRSLVKRLFTSSTGAAPDASRGLPAVQAGSLKAASVSETAMPAAIPTVAGGTSALLKRLESQHTSEEREPVVPSALLEIVVREAANLPTAEWTRAFCVIKLTDGSRELPRMDVAPDATLLAPEDAAMAIYELQTSGLGGWHVLPGQAAHRTEVIEGMDPEWLETFQFGIVDQAKQELRVQVLHKGFMATEFVGEIRLRVEQVLDLVRQQHDDAGILKNAAKSKVSGGGDHGATIAETELAGFAEEWFPLRTAANGRVRNRLGSDSELLLGFKWIQPLPRGLLQMQGELSKKEGSGIADHDDKQRPPMNGGKPPNKRGDWQKRFLVLDPYTQVLREYLPQEGAGTAGACLSRMSVRGATVQDVSMRENRAHSFEIEGPSTTLTCSADNAQNFRDWVSAVKAASGLPAPVPPRPLYRRPFVLCLLLAAILLGIAAAIGLPLWNSIRRSSMVYPLVHNWTVCTLSDGQRAACERCPCFLRCMYGSTFGLQAHSVSNMPHICGSACECQVPGPQTGCGDGLRASYTVDWFGQTTLVEEECDDGNVANGDGCDSLCRTEKYMATHSLGRRVDERGKTLCGGGHSLSACEAACLQDAQCKSLWFGDGFCHIFNGIAPLVPAQPARGRDASLFASHWDELEYACGEGRFQRAFGQDQIRASVMLFGVSDFNNQSHGQALRDVMHVQPFCDTLCSFHVLGISKGSLPFGDAPVNVEQSGGGQSGRRVDVPVVTVTFKLVVSNLTSAATQQQLVAFVNRGENGLWGRLKEQRSSAGTPRFPGLLGTKWSTSEGGFPELVQQPAPPPVAGTLFVKTQYNCTRATDVLRPRGSPAAAADVCCGNRTQMCEPANKCYVSLERQFRCVPLRPPYAPTGVGGLPLDERVRLSWQAPRDTGGLLIDHYIISKVKFVVGQDVVFEPIPPTPTNTTRFDITSLENFVPYYFEVAAVNALGVGERSKRSSSLEPWIFPPSQPLNGRGASGNKRIWIRWDAPRTNGGRDIDEFELWMSNASGLARLPPVWWRLYLAPKGNVTTDAAPPSGEYPITESERRSADLVMTAMVHSQSSASQRRSVAADRDPRSLAFLVTGDADGHPLQASTLYYFRLRARNSYDVSRWSAPVAIRPTGEAPGPPHSIVAMCHAGAAPVACSAGITADAQIEATWNPPVDDGGSAVTGYTLMYGEFGLVMADEAGARGSSMRNLQVATRSTSPITSFVITGLTNDIDYILILQATNQYGNSSRALSGRFTPMNCVVEEDATCSRCTEPFYNIWMGCTPPPCLTPASPNYADTPHTRLRDCTSQGCRLEIFHGTPELGQWGTVSYRSFTQSSAAVACRSLGLRARPEVCGNADSVCGGVAYPPAVLGSGIIWLEGVDCRGTEAKIHDCPAAMRNRIDSITGVYELTKWGLPQQDTSHEIDIGLCCWAPLPAPPFAPTDVIVRMALKLLISLAEFSPGRQTIFRQGIADAALVPVSKVKVANVEPISTSRRGTGAGRSMGRRLLASSIRIDLEVATPDSSAAQATADALTADRVNLHLAKAGLPAAQVLEEASPPGIAPPGTPQPQAPPPAVSNVSQNATGCGDRDSSNDSNGSAGNGTDSAIHCGDANGGNVDSGASGNNTDNANSSDNSTAASRRALVPFLIYPSAVWDDGEDALTVDYSLRHRERLQDGQDSVGAGFMIFALLVVLLMPYTMWASWQRRGRRSKD